MQREIKFRGQRVNTKEWVYGYYVVNDDKESFIITEFYSWETICSDCAMPQFDSYQVIPETVGEYIGLPDKNGKEIYEGDIIHIGDKNIPYIVEWHDNGFMGKAVRASDRIGLTYWNDRIEVIGNIYEKQQLLKEATHD